jgi:lysozyme family protein
MADSRKAIEVVLKHEDPKLEGVVTQDSGGTTKFGIAQKFHPDLDVESLTLDQAEQIYEEQYWSGIRGEEIESQEVAAKLLDMAVNMGIHQAVVLMQRALNVMYLPSLQEDGVCGAKTIAAINACDANLLLPVLRSFCAEFYRHVVAVKPEDQKYLHGWLARANA